MQTLVAKIRDFIPSKGGIFSFLALGASQILGLFTGLGTAYIWTNYVSQDVFGNYNIILSILTIVSVLCLGSMSVSVNISAAKEFDGNFKLIVKYKLLATLVGALLLVAIAFIKLFVKPELRMCLLVSACLFPMWSMLLPRDWLSGKKEFKKVALYESIAKLVQILILFLMAVVLKRKSLEELTLALVAATSALNLIMMIYVLSRLRAFNDKVCKDIIKHGVHFSVSALIGVIAQLDYILIAKFLSIREVAIFALAKLFPEQLKKLFAVFNKMLFPYFASKQNMKELWDWFRYRFVMLCLFFVILGIAGFYAIQYLVPLLFTEKYIDASSYGKWMFLVLALTAPASYFNIALGTRVKKKFYLYFAHIFCPILAFVLLLVFLPMFGLWGAVYSKIAHNLIMAFFFVVYFFNARRKEILSN